MKQSFTLNQCLRLLYKETTPEESAMLREIILHNSTLKQEFTKMRNAYRTLCSAVIAPANESVESILKYNQDSTCMAH